MEKLRRRNEKTTNARTFFPKLDVSTVASKCPYLRQMLVAMRQIVVDAGL